VRKEGGKAMSVPDDVITYIGREGKKFSITRAKDIELQNIHDALTKKAKEIFGDNVQAFDSGMSSSRYIAFPNGGKLRISDHPLPQDFIQKHGLADIDLRPSDDPNKAIEWMNRLATGEVETNAQKARLTYEQKVNQKERDNIAKFIENINNPTNLTRKQRSLLVKRYADSYSPEDFIDKIINNPLVKNDHPYINHNDILPMLDYRGLTLAARDIADRSGLYKRPAWDNRNGNKLADLIVRKEGGKAR